MNTKTFKRTYRYEDIIQRHEDAGICYYLNSKEGVVANLQITRLGYDLLCDLVESAKERADKFEVRPITSYLVELPLPGISVLFSEEDDLHRESSCLADYVNVRPTDYTLFIEHGWSDVYSLIIMHPEMNEVLFEFALPSMSDLKEYFTDITFND